MKTLSLSLSLYWKKKKEEKQKRERGKFFFLHFFRSAIGSNHAVQCPANSLFKRNVIRILQIYSSFPSFKERERERAVKSKEERLWKIKAENESREWMHY